MPDDNQISSSVINWVFVVHHQICMSRYGQYGGKFYKQFMPMGIPMDGVHPPKEVTETIYNFAKRVAERI